MLKPLAVLIDQLKSRGVKEHILYIDVTLKLILLKLFLYPRISSKIPRCASCPDEALSLVFNILVLILVLIIFLFNFRDNPDFKASNQMRNINGYMYGNLPGLRVCKGDNVSWHFMGGPSSQMHTVYFYGNTFIRNGNNHDTLGIMEG